MYIGFFSNVLCVKIVKSSNYSFRLQKGVKIQNKFYFWKLQTLIINQSTLGYRVRPLWKYLQCILAFLNILCGKAVKTTNLQF
eukprot:UN12722